MARRGINIFISSDMNELECEREIAYQTLKEMNIVDPIIFELLPALNKSPYEAFIDEARNCDLL